MRIGFGSFKEQNLEAKNILQEKLKKDFGAVAVEKHVKNEIGFSVEIFSLTKLPWKTEELPMFEWQEKENMIDEQKASNIYDELFSEFKIKEKEEELKKIKVLVCKT